ncbi:MAG TPA: thioredoxin domain-containing protein [Thermoanaerobaculia bacterium]|nr:thioredoxin domain-containing protein [Thermoanaerobaculia bacterium]
MPKFTNRLAKEKSPYLLQHAHNPVDWYPWGEEAIARARREDKPIFLSIGYSTCYWCHVMERESFSDPAIAALMNERFVNVKLDREERPDLDEVYMTATQLMTGQGGWPNSLFLTPKLEPFFAGTYFPPDDKWGRPGFRSVLQGIGDAWTARRRDVDEQARELGDAIRHHLGGRVAPGAGVPGPALFDAALHTLAHRFDPTWGGFGEAPKFPTPSNLMLLLEAAEGGDAEARRMLAATVGHMARGGLYDQLGGGFHRYATDREWKVPHFEKMLYDNGSLLELYARAWALFGGPAGDPELARVVRETVAFLEREMLAPEGAFWSAIDAETGGQEGAFYVWTAAELEGALGAEDAAFLAPLYGFDRPPFFEHLHYVLHLPRPLAEQAERRRVGYEELLASIGPLRERLLVARASRPRPATDDKLLADWNGLAIAGLAVAGRLLGEPGWLQRAARAANFVLGTMRPRGEGGGQTLLHAWRAGVGEVPAFLADYAYLVHGLLELHEATSEQRWLDAAVELTDEQRRRLAHPDGGFYNAGGSADLLARARELFDGASPSANGLALLNFVRLAERTGDRAYRDEAERALRGFAPLAEAQPAAARTVAIAVRRFHATADSTARGGDSVAVAHSAEETVDLVTAELELSSPGDDGWRPFLLRLRIVPGWHVNTAEAPAGFGAAIVEAVDGELRALQLPPRSRKLALGRSEPLPVWEGEVEIRGDLRANADAAPALRVVVQPCDESRCLAPLTLVARHRAPSL